MTRHVQILAFDGMEVLDYAGPYEVFNVAGEQTSPAAFTVQAVGVSPRPAGRGGFEVVPVCQYSEAPAADILVIPGGRGTRPLMRDQSLLAWIAGRAADAELVMTVCTGALLAAAAGLLDGLAATTHHGAFGELERAAPTATVVRGVRFVRSAPRLYTSAGVSAGVDLALHVVEELAGGEARAATEAEMEWMWNPRPGTAELRGLILDVTASGGPMAGSRSYPERLPAQQQQSAYWSRGQAVNLLGSFHAP